MTNIEFMQKKYTYSELINHYLDNIRALKPYISSPAEESKLQDYIQAVTVFKQISIKDIVQFGLSYGRNVSGKAAQMREAFPIILGNRVTQPSKIDLAYARLLLDYAQAFKEYRFNLKDWMLRFILCSRFSPIYSLFERELEGVIDNTKQKIAYYSQNIK